MWSAHGGTGRKLFNEMRLLFSKKRSVERRNPLEMEGSFLSNNIFRNG